MNNRFSETPVDIQSIERLAQRLRISKAEALSENINNLPAFKSLGTHHRHYADDLPLPSGQVAIEFNDLVTDSVLREHVLNETDPYLVTFLGAKVVEQSFYQFLDPSQPSKPIKNLSVAKHFGTFFTPPDIAYAMAKGLLYRKSSKTLIDPCAGSGVLLCAVMLERSPTPYQKIIAVELDEQIANWAKLILNRVAQLTNYLGEVEVHTRDGLDFLLSQDSFSTTPDVIINPPYGRIRVTSDRFTNDETQLITKSGNIANSLKRLQDNLGDYAAHIRSKYPAFARDRGVLEYSKLFFRACGELAHRGGAVSIISPDSWMSGGDGANLRTFLMNNRLVEEILLVPENSRKFSTVNQALGITFLTNENRKHFVLSEFGTDERFNIQYEYLEKNLNTHYAIPRVSGTELELFESLGKLKKFSDIQWIVNVRGELDQTSQKFMFQRTSQPIRLARGEHVERFAFIHSSTEKKPSFISAEDYSSFMGSRPKANHIKFPRIVGRQCSYAQQNRRLIFCTVPPGVAIGNSCNYLHIKEFEDESSSSSRINLVLGILNSAVLDWFFRIENSNNHVANYEIDNFPFPPNEKWFDLIISLTHQLTEARASGNENRCEWLSDLLEAAVALAYNLKPDSELRAALSTCKHPRVERVLNYANHMSRGIKISIPRQPELFFNNQFPTLSALDREIISHVPEGGNWQNIPESVPSERIKQIRQMSAERGVVRTTYYGRLRRDQPAYTISTYFNRPGNGTHIHPVHDRTLTSREAARLQTFPDSYIFAGSEGAIRDQIGNAVPPLLALEIGRKLALHGQNMQCVDMFCGAGGLSLGLEASGWHVLAAIDHNADALDTYCLNRPCDLEPDTPSATKTAVYRRDLHDKESLNDICGRIQRTLGENSLDLLVGGPPCQGFSHAGFRLSDDKRNDLASIYLHFAERLKPRIFILENVEGLATYKGGRVLADICETLNELGYRVNDPVWKLCAEQYGVPQMRRRVFVVATLDPNVDLRAPQPTHERCLGRRLNLGQKSMFTDNLPTPWTVAHALSGLSMPYREDAAPLLEWYDSAYSSSSGA